MAEQGVQFVSFNRGLISRYALARVDLQRMHMSAAVMTNWMPRVFGSMMLRPGLAYAGLGTRANAFAKMIPFIRASDDVAIVEATDSNLRVLVNDAAVTRPAVTAAITNGGFVGNITGWTGADETGATSAYQAVNQMALTGTGFNAAIRYQTVTCHEPGTEHALRIVVNRGPVLFRVGSTVGGEDYITTTTLGTGTHSLAFTPAGNFTVEVLNRLSRMTLVGSIQVEAAGVMLLPTPWALAALPNLRADQSADVLYICDGSVQQRKIERRGVHSWSIVLYEPEDGPFLVINASQITLDPSAATGEITIVASDTVFRASHVGALFKLASSSQDVQADLSGNGQFSDPIRVTGVGGTRAFTIVISGTWTGTLSVESSAGEPGDWARIKSFTMNATYNHNDGLDNEIIYYRIGFEGTDYGSGTAHVDLSFQGGSISGVARITAVTDGKNANAVVIQRLGDANPTTLWYEGAWSNYRGWPSAPAIYEGRLWWVGATKFFGSVSDAYESFDDTIIGDSGPIQRGIGSGPVDTINWALPLQRLLVGTTGSEVNARSSAIDEPLTPTNFNLKSSTTQGTARVNAAKVDTSGFFVQRSGLRVYELAWNPNPYAGLDYSATDITALVSEIGKPGITLLAVQRQPDTRLHCLRSDGTVAIYVMDKVEEVQCWIEFETDGIVEDICVLPGVAEDQVYYLVNRTVGGVATRMYEKWALESECRGGTLNKQADSFVLYSGAAVNAIPGNSHLIGRSVVVWADGKDYSPGRDDVFSGGTQKTYVVDMSGNVTLDVGVTVSNAVVGLPYTADYQSVKLAYAAQFGSALGMRKRIGKLGVILADTHYQGLAYGGALDGTQPLDDMPLVEGGVETPSDTVWPSYDMDNFEHPGAWGPDERLCLRASSPRPCNVLAAIVVMETEG